MSYRTNLFSKMMILILIMLIPVVLLYGYSNHKTTAVLRAELNRSNSTQLEFFKIRSIRISSCCPRGPTC